MVRSVCFFQPEDGSLYHLSCLGPLFRFGNAPKLEDLLFRANFLFHPRNFRSCSDHFEVGVGDAGDAVFRAWSALDAFCLCRAFGRQRSSSRRRRLFAVSHTSSSRPISTSPSPCLAKLWVSTTLFSFSWGLGQVWGAATQQRAFTSSLCLLCACPLSEKRASITSLVPSSSLASLETRPGESWIDLGTCL
jgi:hypothetical protein